MSVPIISVLLPLPLSEPFDYLATSLSPPPPGTLVRVPFGSREVVGVVWDQEPGNKVAIDRLKQIKEIIQLPLIPASLCTLVNHVAADNVASLGSALRLVLSVPAALEPPPMCAALALGNATGEIADDRWITVLQALNSGPLTQSALTKKTGVSAAVIKKISANGFIQKIMIDRDVGDPSPTLAGKPVDFRDDQQKAVALLRTTLEQKKKPIILLEGEPGSGKTEIYFEAIELIVRRGQSALVLLPEIALSAQWFARFERRFGVAPTMWHSGLTSAQRRRIWKSVLKGEPQVVVGARSALFLPLPNLGLIIIDEEHDPSFKQEDGVIYDGRQVARKRADLAQCPLILCSATPSLETVFDAREKPAQVDHISLTHRHGKAARPKIVTADLRREKPPAGRFLGTSLVKGLSEALARGEQAMLFLNRRGFAPLTLCRACGYRLRCPNCSSWLVTHRFRERLVCHHCSYYRPLPDYCPECGALETLVTAGPGVERIAEEVETLMPDARLAIMTSDTVGSANSATKLVNAMLEREIDILIGTQLIAKGHHFPHLTLVGVVDADLGLAGGDPRAAERSFQLLYQLAGRAGREELPGQVIVQTHLPDHPVMQAIVAGDKARFLEAELAEREEAGLPPFGRLAALIIAGPDADRVRSQSRRIVRAAPQMEDFYVLGPAPAPLALMRGRYRERVLIKAGPDIDLPATLSTWLTPIRLPSAVRLQVDVDPQSFF